MKSKCCKKFKKKGRSCGSCPVVSKLNNKDLKKLLAKYS